jgi:diguanylate cyclase (GGDEF)-like protein
MTRADVRVNVQLTRPLAPLWPMSITPHATMHQPLPIGHGDVLGSQSQMQQQSFLALLQGVSIVAGLTHLSFFALFTWAHVDALAYVNIASILSYVWVFFLARKGLVWQAWAVTVIEVLGHAVLAVMVIGWESGFHLYILLVIPVAVVSSIRPLPLKMLTVVAVAFTYLALDMLVRHSQPPRPLPATVLDGLHYFNVLGAMLILVFLAGYYYYLNIQAEQALHNMASTDPLTGLCNRRAVNDAIKQEERRVRRTHEPLAFALCDIDHFKSVNDTHGHDAGDEVLRAVSKALASSVREMDIVARWGGEEFLVVMPATPQPGAELVGERLRTRVDALEIEVNGKVLRVSMTLGLALLDEGETCEQAIARADRALYEGKHAGRNRMVLATQPAIT